MADFYFDVDVALTEVPVNLMPLIDDTDFKTIEDAVAYNAAGLALFWHFVTSAGVYNNGVAVTPTTAGVYDWVDHGTHGIFTIEIPASGGASINNDTEGYGWFTGVATGILPWRGPVIGFRAAAINDALMDGGDLLDVSLVQVAGATTDVSALATNVAAILVDTAEIGAAGAGLTALATAAALATVDANVDNLVSGIIFGAAAAGTLSTTQASSNLSGYSNDQLIGRPIIWLTGACAGEASTITDYVSTAGVLTFDALIATPGNGDTFKIV